MLGHAELRTTLRLLFFCSSLAPDRDGVGDYTRTLAGQCVRLGHECRLIALNDRFLQVGAETYENQLVGDGTLPCMRLPSLLEWSVRMKSVERWARDFLPDLCSLQYVPYGYHPKGLPWKLPLRLGAIFKSSVRWHIMFHEICVGLGPGAPIKHRVVGAIQKRIAAGLLKSLRPVCVHTHAEPYLDFLRTLGADAKPLRLFSNIPIPRDCDGTPENENVLGSAHCLNIAFFGTVHSDWNLLSVIELVKRIGLSQNRVPQIIAIGKGGGHAATTWGVFRKSGIEIEETGICNQSDVSHHLLRCSYGLSGYPPDLIQKSSAAAAMFEHGLPVLIPRPTLWGNRYKDTIREDCPLALFGNSLIEDACIVRNASVKNNLSSNVIRKFLSDIA